MVETIWTLGKKIRPAAIAGLFYPAHPSLLRKTVARLLEEAATDAPAPKAMIVPHAGYVYSGPVAASAYARLRNRSQPIERVVLLGPDHRVGFVGMGVPSADWFITPLGRVPVDREALEAIADLPGVVELDQAHALEHSLEVHLPFLQLALGAFKVVPIVVSQATPEQVAAVLERLWGGPETLIVISSDLSHYHDYATARRLDAATIAAIEALRGERIGPEDACGFLPIRGLLQVLSKKHLPIAAIDVRNSGDTAGPRDQVVGYGACVAG